LAAIFRTIFLDKKSLEADVDKLQGIKIFLEWILNF